MKKNKTDYPGRFRWSFVSLFTVFLGLCLPVSQVQAIATGDSKTLLFHGTLRIHQCHINNDQNISVQFDEVGINKVDGARYKQQIPWQLTCDDYDPAWRLTLLLKGTAATFDNAAISTNAAGLAIQIQQNGKPLELNKAIDIQYGSIPTLEAVPVKDPAVTELTAGIFNATATLLAEYL